MFCSLGIPCLAPSASTLDPIITSLEPLRSSSLRLCLSTPKSAMKTNSEIVITISIARAPTITLLTRKSIFGLAFVTDDSGITVFAHGIEKHPSAGNEIADNLHVSYSVPWRDSSQISILLFANLCDNQKAVAVCEEEANAHLPATVNFSSKFRVTYRDVITGIKRYR